MNSERRIYLGYIFIDENKISINTYFSRLPNVLIVSSLQFAAIGFPSSFLHATPCINEYLNVTPVVYIARHNPLFLKKTVNPWYLALPPSSHCSHRNVCNSTRLFRLFGRRFRMWRGRVVKRTFPFCLLKGKWSWTEKEAKTIINGKVNACKTKWKCGFDAKSFVCVNWKKMCTITCKKNIVKRWDRFLYFLFSKSFHPIFSPSSPIVVHASLGSTSLLFGPCIFPVFSHLARPSLFKLDRIQFRRFFFYLT